MSFKATHRFARISPRKARLVMNLIKGRDVDEALTLLRFSKLRSAVLIGKVVQSAVANAGEQEANRLAASFHLANEEVFLKSQEEDAYQGMGTTMVALHFSKNKERAAIAHAGDSRCYRLRKRDLVQLTTDHTLGAAGIVGPSASVLSKAIGIEENLEPDVMVDIPQPGDVYLICSDGLSRMASNEEITEILVGDRDLEKVCAALIDKANLAGGRDNVTVILVRVDRATMHA